jgi:transcriptional regulator with XRE-family HTH domain
MENLMQRLGETLHIARRRAKKTIREVSTETGISPTIISLVETGKRPQVSFDVIAHLAHALGVSLDTLANEDAATTPQLTERLAPPPVTAAPTARRRKAKTK